MLSIYLFTLVTFLWGLIATPVSIGLAKKFETIIIPEKVSGRFEFHEVRLPLSSPAVNLVRRIRDEAHRFAVSYHRTLRSKGFLQNSG